MPEVTNPAACAALIDRAGAAETRGAMRPLPAGSFRHYSHERRPVSPRIVFRTLVPDAPSPGGNIGPQAADAPLRQPANARSALALDLGAVAAWDPKADGARAVPRSVMT